MSDLTVKFTAVAERVKKMTKTPSNGELLNLYGLYKQSTLGDNTTTRPLFIDLKGQKKWDAWTSHKGMKKAAAMLTYIDYAEEVMKKHA